MEPAFSHCTSAYEEAFRASDEGCGGTSSYPLTGRSRRGMSPRHSKLDILPRSEIWSGDPRGTPGLVGRECQGPVCMRGPRLEK